MCKYSDKLATMATAVAVMMSISAATHASDVGMPQFDGSHFTSQFFWLVITFVILFILMWKVALPRVGEALDNREQKIANDIEKAEELKLSAEKIQLELDKTLAKARADGQAVIAKTNAQIAKDQEKKIAAFAIDLDHKTSEAESRIEESRKAALASVSEVAAEVTQAAVIKLGGTIDDKAVARALDVAAKEG